MMLEDINYDSQFIELTCVPAEAEPLGCAHASVLNEFISKCLIA